MNSIARASVAALMVFGLAACADDPEPVAGGGAEGFASGSGANALDPTSIEYFNVNVGDRVFFETNSSALTPLARQTLTRQAQWLQQNLGTTAVIEGHADERGTREFNLALGARRAAAAFDFLSAQGVAPTRLRTVSYGKERPVETCSAENCWAQNRRAVTVAAGAPLS